jgi:hypothetical protein
VLLLFILNHQEQDPAHFLLQLGRSHKQCSPARYIFKRHHVRFISKLAQTLLFFIYLVLN